MVLNSGNSLRAKFRHSSRIDALERYFWASQPGGKTEQNKHITHMLFHKKVAITLLSYSIMYFNVIVFTYGIWKRCFLLRMINLILFYLYYLILLTCILAIFFPSAYLMLWHFLSWQNSWSLCKMISREIFTLFC